MLLIINILITSQCLWISCRCFKALFNGVTGLTGNSIFVVLTKVDRVRLFALKLKSFSLDILFTVFVI